MEGKTVKGLKFSMVRTWIVVFWIMTPSNIMDWQQSFWRTYSLHFSV